MKSNTGRTLGDKLRSVRHMLDLQAQIVEHPWPAIAVAVLFGAWVGLEAPKPAPGEPSAHSRLAGAILATAGAIALRVVREVALREASGAARRWYDHATDADRERQRDRARA